MNVLQKKSIIILLMTITAGCLCDTDKRYEIEFDFGWFQAVRNNKQWIFRSGKIGGHNLENPIFPDIYVELEESKIIKLKEINSTNIDKYCKKYSVLLTDIRYDAPRGKEGKRCSIGTSEFIFVGEKLVALDISATPEIISDPKLRKPIYRKDAEGKKYTFPLNEKEIEELFGKPKSKKEVPWAM